MIGLKEVNGQNDLRDRIEVNVQIVNRETINIIIQNN